LINFLNKKHANSTPSEETQLSFDDIACRSNVLQAITRSYLTSRFYLFEDEKYPNRKFDYSNEQDLYHLNINAKKKTDYLIRKIQDYFFVAPNGYEYTFKVNLNTQPHQILIRFFDKSKNSYTNYYSYNFSVNENEVGINVEKVNDKNNSTSKLKCPLNNFISALNDLKSFNYKKYHTESSNYQKGRKLYKDILADVYND
jgi:hypothetical protein